MENNTDHSNQWVDEIPPQASYSLEEAAAFLAVRADDLAAILPDVGIDLPTREGRMLTRDDVERLERLIGSFQQIASESMYGARNL